MRHTNPLGTVVVLTALAAATAALGQTVIVSSALDDHLRQLDVATQEILAEQTVRLDGAILHGLSAIASQPGTGTLFGVLREARCPGDSSRTDLARGSCNEFSSSPVVCDRAFAIENGVPVSCEFTGISCAPCVPANEGPLGCTNTCLGTPTCEDAGLTFAGNGGCAAFNGQAATCVQRFAQSECGPVPCFADASGTLCRECTPFAVALGKCLPTCGPLASRDPVHLVTIDPTSARATSRGNLGDDVSGLVFTCDGTLHGVTGDARCREALPELLTIDPASATFTSALTFPDDGGAGLAFDPIGLQLLRASGSLDDATLRAIDPGTFGVTVRPLTGPVTTDEPAAIVWEPPTGALVWSHPGAAGPLFRVPADGASVALGEVGRRVDGMAFAGPGVCAACGDGTVQGDETCDDGNVVGGDCCSATCSLAAGGVACTADEDPCTDDRCDGNGRCAHTISAGLAGADCLLGRLVDPEVCAPDPLDAKVGRTLRKRGGKARALVTKAIANAAKAAKKVKAARRQVAGISRTVAKRRAKLTPSCATHLDGILAVLDEHLTAS